MAQVLAVFAELERRLIGQRTREALAVRKAQGVRLGRPPVLPAEVVSRIVSARELGVSWSAIGRALDTDGGELTSQWAVVGASWARLGAGWAQNAANSRTAVSTAER